MTSTILLKPPSKRASSRAREAREKRSGWALLTVQARCDGGVPATRTRSWMALIVWCDCRCDGLMLVFVLRNRSRFSHIQG